MVFNVNSAELFPTKWSAVIFISYMILFVNQGLLVTASQGNDNSYSYNTVLAVLLTEFVKLFISVVLYCKDNACTFYSTLKTKRVDMRKCVLFCSRSFWSLWNETKTNKKVLRLYFIPALLYCLYNNLAFVNLSAFDPTTYYLLLQLRVVVTGVLFQIIFKKQLTGKQWMSLALLTVGCMLKQIPFPKEVAINLDSVEVNFVTPPGALNKETGAQLTFHFFLLIVQVICSCLAGVYNEYLLKQPASEVNIYLQNIFMYVDSIVCNIAVLLFTGQGLQVLTKESIDSVLHYKVLLVILNNATVGIVTSFFLRSLNSILKTFASALELVFTAVLSSLLFDIPIHTNTVCAIAVVSLAVILYSRNPVSVTNSTSNSSLTDIPRPHLRKEYSVVAAV